MSDNSPGQSEIDVHNNPESRAYEESTTQRVSRANDGGAPPREAPRAGETPENLFRDPDTWNPVAGREISDEDRDAAVTTDDNATEVDGPAVGHA